VFWFRRDLRLADHPALADAATSGPVVGVFVVDRALWDPAGANRLAYLARSLDALDRSTGRSLVVRAGDPSTVLTDLAREVGAERVVASADFGPYGRRRDEVVARSLEATGRRLDLIDSPYAVAPGTIRTGSGSSYKVFTPFLRSWRAAGWAEPIDAVAVDWARPADRGRIPAGPEPTAALPPAGEGPATEAAERFLADGVDGYADRRDLPGRDATSRLSPYLRWGQLHPRQLLSRLGGSAGEEAFRTELAWREFYAEVLADRPDSARSAYRAEMATMEVDRGPDTDARFAAWCEGRTGYPIVDAGMRQLVAEGWMHNRVRMIVASFLVKDLHLDWTRGARFFMEHLVDGDLASNQHGWQWVAGTGTDAAPYFRIFNPVTQSRRFDPDGDYIRRWVPELALLPNRSVHAPWTERNGAPAAYPGPIVDHAEERADAMGRYDRWKAHRA
jgi:deoxyribodipyrimidine photo-lyase